MDGIPTSATRHRGATGDPCAKGAANAADAAVGAEGQCGEGLWDCGLQFAHILFFCSARCLVEDGAGQARREVVHPAEVRRTNAAGQPVGNEPKALKLTRCHCVDRTHSIAWPSLHSSLPSPLACDPLPVGPCVRVPACPRKPCVWPRLVRNPNWPGPVRRRCCA